MGEREGDITSRRKRDVEKARNATMILSASLVRLSPGHNDTGTQKDDEKRVTSEE